MKILACIVCCSTFSHAATSRRSQKLIWAIGRDLYRENCAVCHDIEKDKAHSHKFGPSLNHLFKNETLPMSHGKPSRAICGSARQIRRRHDARVRQAADAG